jgi:hydroxymethylbilane synthase
MVTRGDIILDQPLARIGGKGLFLKELERALLRDEADIAVHSMKDVPVEEVPGLIVEVMLARANPYDAWLSRDGRGLAELPEGSRVGTSSLRRQCQLRSLRPDLQVLDLRGNVNTRLRKLDEGQYDAIVLACAGLERLGLGGRISEVLEPPGWLPAATQGTIGVQCRAGDDSVMERISVLNDDDAVIRTRAERAVAKALQGSCQVPLAVFAELDAGQLRISGMVGKPDGTEILRAQRAGDRAAADVLAADVSRELIAQGADRIIEALRQ